MDARSKLRENRVLKPQKGNKRLYRVGEEVILQNPTTKLWDIPAQIISCRTAPDGKVLSYELKQHNGTVTTRHRVFIRPSLPETNDVMEEEADTGVAVDDLLLSQKQSQSHQGFAAEGELPGSIATRVPRPKNVHT